MTVAGGAQRPRRRWVWVLVALATLTAFMVPFRLRLMVPNGNMQHQFDPPVSYRRAISGLQVEASAGGMITIRAGRPGQVTVSSSLAWLLRKPVVTQTWQGGLLGIGATCPKFDPLQDCQASITVSVPAGTAVQARAGAGSVLVTGLTGPLHLSATSGVLVARNISGPVWASVTSGSVLARTGIRSQHVYASATAGQITLAFATPPRTVAVGLGAGSAGITVPAGSRYRIVSSAGAGALFVAPGLRDARSDLVLEATIGAGAARIGYPPGPD